jgi:signal transduction histidine kinase/predicted RNA-binding protein with RPS1 domain/DNA-binding response OmpR family regulator
MSSEKPSQLAERNYPRWSRASGRVTKVRQFGVFVEFEDGVQGIIRRRELAWDNTPPRDLITPGQRIEAVVIDIDHKTQRLELSLRLVEYDPWPEFLEAHKPGSVVRGHVQRVMPYGAFVEISPGVVGLLHIGELAPSFVEKVEDVLWVGDDVKAQILSIDPSKRHVSLSIKQYLKRLEHDATQATVADYVSRKPTSQVSLGDQLGLSARQLKRQIGVEPERKEPARGAGRILVVDDEESLADSMERWIYGLGYEVETAYTGEAGVERALRGDYGLVFMDLNLPDINGLEATRRILAQRPGTKITLMTGANLADEYSAEIEATDLTSVLLKPFVSSEVEALLERLESDDGLEGEPPSPQSEDLTQEVLFFQRVSRMVGDRGTLAHAFTQALNELGAETQASASAVFEMDPMTRTVSLVAHSGNALAFDQHKHRLSESPVKDVILDQQVVWENDVKERGAARFRFLSPLLTLGACIGVPIKAQDNVRHGLFLFHARTGHFTHHHLQRALSTSLVMTAAIERRTVERMVQSLQRLNLVGQLSGGLAHEVNNKLASVEFHTQDLLKGFDRLAREQADAVGTFLYRDLHRSAETIAQMNRGALETARMFQTLMKGEDPQMVNVNDIARRTLRLLNPLARKHQVELKDQLGEGIPRTWVVGVRLQQALHNVVLNAIQQIAQNDAGGRVELVSEHTPDDPVYPIKIHITDDGPGIHRQHYDQVFSLGFSTRRHEGTGLGLYITRGLIESMGGQVHIAESAILIGTTFLIELPLITKE